MSSKTAQINIPFSLARTILIFRQNVLKARLSEFVFKLKRKYLTNVIMIKTQAQYKPRDQLLKSQKGAKIHTKIDLNQTHFCSFCWLNCCCQNIISCLTNRTHKYLISAWIPTIDISICRAASHLGQSEEWICCV